MNNRLIWYTKNKPAQSIWSTDDAACEDIAKGLKAVGFTVVWTISTADSVLPKKGYEQEFETWKKL